MQKNRPRMRPVFFQLKQVSAARLGAAAAACPSGVAESLNFAAIPYREAQAVHTWLRAAVRKRQLAHLLVHRLTYLTPVHDDL